MRRLVLFSLTMVTTLCCLNTAIAAAPEAPRRVDAQPLPNKSGYNPVVSARMANVPSGNSVETTLTVQTDLDPQSKQEIPIRLFSQEN